MVTASFSKHRLRAFDSIWYGFALNGHASWSRPGRPIDEYQADFTRAFTRHYYDARTAAAANTLAESWERLDRCKSRLELANQTLGDVVGVYDTQEAGYQGNSLMGAFRKCGKLTAESPDALATIRPAAVEAIEEAQEVMGLIDAQRPHVGRIPELADLWLAGEKIAAHAEREVLMIDAQAALLEAEDLPVEAVRRKLAQETGRWAAHRERVSRIDRRTEQLYSRGDPLGLISLLRDIAAIEAHLERLAQSGAPSGGAPRGEVLLDERFEALDAERWFVLGEPNLVDGHMETRAPGGWENYCGIATREAFPLEDDRPLVVEFELTPIEMGIDSQLFGSAAEDGRIGYQFTFYGPTSRFGIYTQSATELEGPWADPEPGWKARAFSPEVMLGKTYRVRAEVTRRTWRVTVHDPEDGPWQPAFWDTGPAPMDAIDEARLAFTDVEPEGGKGASRWGPITIWRGETGAD